MYISGYNAQKLSYAQAMELFAVLLSSLLAVVSPANLILDRAIEETLRSRLAAVEQLEVRLDNAPSYQVLAGKVDRVRIASRGLQPIAGLRIEVLELEAEPVNVDLRNAGHSQAPSFYGESSADLAVPVEEEARTRNSFPSSEHRQLANPKGGVPSDLQRLRGEKLSGLLDQPLQGGIRIVLTEADLNLALQTPEIQSRLQQLLDRSLPQGIVGAGGYKLLNPRLQLDHRRVQLQAQLQSASSSGRSLDVSLESGIKVVAGRRLELIEPEGTINGRPLSNRLLQGVAQVLSSRLDLRGLEPSGITARLLQLEIEDEQIRLAAFVNVEAQ